MNHRALFHSIISSVVGVLALTWPSLAGQAPSASPTPPASTAPNSAQPPTTMPTTMPTPTGMTEMMWREDLRVLAQMLAEKHKDPFTIVTREQFTEAVERLNADLGRLNDAQVYFELKRLVAMVGDAHTNVSDGKGRFATPYLPISVLPLADGVFVTASTPGHRDLQGMKVVRIGDADINEAIDRLGAFISHENRAWLIGQVNFLILTPTALERAGLTTTADEVRFTLQDAAGVERQVALESMRPGERQTATPVLEQERLYPTMRRRPEGAIFGSMLLPDSRDLYVWYDACRDAPDKTVKQFAEETLDTIEREGPERIILDLRRNSGGNSALIGPLISGLANRRDLKQPGRLFVLIGHGTFSSGLWAALDFKNRTSAILVGGPTGGKPNSFGEQRSVTLPNSGLTLFYSTKKWIRDRNHDGPSLEPSILAEHTWVQLSGGRDAAIEAVRAYKTD